VLTTSALGIYLCRTLLLQSLSQQEQQQLQLQHGGDEPEAASSSSTVSALVVMHWALLCIYATKACILFCADASDLFYCFACFALVSAPVLLYPSSSSSHGSHNSKMSPKRGVAHGAAIVAILFASRRVLLGRLLQALLPLVLSGNSFRAVTSTMIFSAFLVASCVAVLPLSFHHFGHLAAVRRANSISLVIAGVFAFMQPDLDGYASSGGGGPPQWPVWLLFGAIALLIVSVAFQWLYMRFVLGVVLGTCVGLYVCATYVPQANVLQYVLFGGMFNCVAQFLLFSYWPAPSPTTNFYVFSATYAGFVLLEPVTFVYHTTLYGYAPRRQGKDLLVQSRVTLLAIAAALNFLVALCVKLMTSTTDLGVKDTRTAASSASSFRGVQKRGFGVRTHRSSFLYASDPEMLCIHLGNVATCMTLVHALVLNLVYLDTGGSGETCILFLAPILLLLNQDTGLLQGLTDERRYFPIIAVTCAFLAFSAVNQIALHPFLEYMHWVPSSTASAAGAAAAFHFGSGSGAGFVFSWMSLLKNAVLLAATLPALWHFITFLWLQRNVGDFPLIFVLPINILPLALADLFSIQLLAVIAVVGVCFQLFALHQIRHHGMSII
jgi:hypothetical protein